MAFKLEQFKNNPHYDEVLKKLNEPPTASKSSPTPVSTPETLAVQPITVTFTVRGAPVGKPRMTQQDKWRKRKCVVRYWEYCNRIRSSTKPLPPGADAVAIVAFMPMPKAWNKKEKTAKAGSPHRQKSDADNILKGAIDALFSDDSCIWDMRVKKFWAVAGEERTEITVLYLNDR